MDGWFRKMYVWAMNVKLFMALYLIVMVFTLSVVALLSGRDSVRIVNLLETLLTCMLVGVAQSLLLDDRADYAHGIFFGRSVLWLALSTALSVGAALLFGWFAGLPGWTYIAFGAFMLFAFTLTLVGLKLEQDTETVRLNSDLRRFKAKAQ
ncbi:MAG: DUF4175 domain-containing protein [Clostridiales bacterium]|nr:DUF4175 domain-containing protein [Clostridiales bacterium]